MIPYVSDRTGNSFAATLTFSTHDSNANVSGFRADSAVFNRPTGAAISASGIVQWY